MEKQDINHETVLTETVFRTNTILFWLTDRFTLSDKRLTGTGRKSILLDLLPIPFGKWEYLQPLKTIASVSYGTRFSFAKFVLGLIFLALGFDLMPKGSFYPGLVITFIGVIYWANCYYCIFKVTNTGGESYISNVSILEKSKVVAFEKEVNNTIADLK